MPKIRFTVSLDEELLQQFDNHINGQSYTNRSEAIRDLIRQQIISEEWESGTEVIGSITMVYDHNQRESSKNLTHLQHEYNEDIVSTQHIHIDHDNCLEVVVVRGGVDRIIHLYNALRSSHGVKQCELTKSTTGRYLT